MKKYYPYFGIIASLSYIAGVIIGGTLIPGYSHLYNTISELTVSNAPKPTAVVVLFVIYNLCLMAFGLGLMLYSSASSVKSMRVSARMIIVTALLGIGMLFFSQDPRDGVMTFDGRMHLMLAGFSSLTTMLAIILAAIAFKKVNELKSLEKYSYISFVAVFIAGGLSGITIANNSPVGGLFERLVIGAFIQWILVIGIKMGFSVSNKAKGIETSV